METASGLRGRVRDRGEYAAGQLSYVSLGPVPFYKEVLQ